MKPFASDKERGTALITAILLVALMATIALSLIDISSFALFRTANSQARDQAYWYAMGARDYAEELLAEFVGNDEDPIASNAPWLSGRVFPIEGGQIVISVRDLNNCFNPNSLIGPQEEAQSANDQKDVVRARTLLLGLNMDPVMSESLVNQMADWVDSDGYPRFNGAEDETYSVLTPPYRAANQAMVVTDEVLALPAMNAQAYQVLAPWLCVRDERLGHSLNVNTLRLDQAALLYAWFAGDLSYSDAEAVLFRRPSSGYENVEDFWTDPAITALNIADAARSGVTLHSRLFELDIAVELHGMQFRLREAVEVTGRDQVHRVRQRFGAME
ncbi:type II secretion system minor pseudopilin GspK [Woodsholea maritima]|uniref:type II secretion system minor pseudopilin GspK n=1 Tax=Woodsholea maritima TaxID=240237 RepID=UPI00036BCA3F|nr:type II secretion system minor pseudopilin GspK [Woodsholea maritima]